MQVNKKYCSQLERKIQSVKQEMNVVQEKLGKLLKKITYNSNNKLWLL